MIKKVQHYFVAGPAYRFSFSGSIEDVLAPFALPEGKRSIFALYKLKQIDDHKYILVSQASGSTYYGLKMLRWFLTRDPKFLGEGLNRELELTITSENSGVAQYRASTGRRLMMGCFLTFVFGVVLFFNFTLLMTEGSLMALAYFGAWVLILGFGVGLSLEYRLACEHDFITRGDFHMKTKELMEFTL